MLHIQTSSNEANKFERKMDFNESEHTANKRMNKQTNKQRINLFASSNNDCAFGSRRHWYYLQSLNYYHN